MLSDLLRITSQIAFLSPLFKMFLLMAHMYQIVLGTENNVIERTCLGGP